MPKTKKATKTKKTKPVITEIPSPRLKKCLELGSVNALFPVLQDWSKAELKALVQDVDLLFDTRLEKINEKVEEISKLEGCSPEALERAKQGVTISLLGVCAEISSVALYYLSDEILVDKDNEHGG